MPLNIVKRIPTTNMERQLLNELITNQFVLQRTIGKHREDFFTSRNRLLIYQLVNFYFNSNRSLLTKDSLNFELNKRYDATRDKQLISDVSDEYDIILNTPANDTAEVIISKLEEVLLASNVDTLLKEVNDTLQKGDIEEAVKMLRSKAVNLKDKQKDGRVINLHKDSADWFEEIQRRHDNPELYTGIPTGFEKFDKLTGGLFPAELTVVFGLSGKGKSTFMKAMATNIRKQNRVVLHCGNEENEFQMRTKYMSVDSGEQYSHFKRGSYTEEEFNRLKKYSDSQRDVGAIYVYEFPQQTDVTCIERAYQYLKLQGVKVDVIIIDYLDLMKPVEQAYSENDEQGKITSDLKQLAINCCCPVVTATQAGTQSEKQEKKDNPFLTAADVFGTKRKVHSANTLIGIVNKTATAVQDDTQDKSKHRMVLCVPKNRDGAVFTFRQIMDVKCGRFYEDDDPNSAIYNNLEKQAEQMIDDSQAPDKIRGEIDVEELQKAREQELVSRVEKINDSFVSEAPDYSSSTATVDTTITVSEESDPFVSEAPDFNSNSSTINNDDIEDSLSEESTSASESAFNDSKNAWQAFLKSQQQK